MAKKVFIDAMSIAEERVSGIGHTAVSLVHALAADADFCSNYELVLLVPVGKKKGIRRWDFPEHVRIQTYPLFDKVLNVLNRLGLLIPLDILIGRGIYLFPNFRNWPVAFSKSLTYVHDVTYLKYPQFVQEANLHMLQKSMPRWMHRTDAIITVSQAAKQDILEHTDVAEHKVAVVPNGVDLEIFKRSSEEEIKRTKETYDIEGDYFFYVSNLEPRKNVERLVRAFASLNAAKKQQVALVIVGNDGWRNESILQALDEAARGGVRIIRPKQYVPDQDLPPLYSGSVALVHPALYEGFGISPLQAMACETPVLTSNTSSMPEVVGDNALLVDPLDEDAIREGLEALYTNPSLRRKITNGARDRAMHYSWTRSAATLHQVIAEVAKS